MGSEGEKVAEFIELHSAEAKAPLVCERTMLHYERGETVAVYTPDEDEAADLDVRLWTFRQNAFIPHVRLEEAAGDVSADGGSVGTSMISWVEPPHFYKTAKLLVLYGGTDSRVMQLPEDVLGEQFAGR